MANVKSASSNAVQISVILNKSKKDGRGCIVTFLHNAVIKCQKADESVQWIEFRLLGSDKEGNVSKSPMFATQGRKEVAVDAEKFMAGLYSTSEVDVRFTFDMDASVTDALLDGGKALKITFGLGDLKEEGETEYQGQWTKKVRVLNPQLEVLDSYHGVGRTIDPEAVAAALEAAALAPKSQYITSSELAESADKLVSKSRNARRKDAKRAEKAASLLNNIAAEAVTSSVIVVQPTTPVVETSEEAENIEEGVEVDELDAFTMDLLGLG